MPNYSKGDVILVRYPFSDLSGSKVRPSVVVSAPHVSDDMFIVPLTSKSSSLFAGEFALADWRNAGLNVPSVVKRGIYTIEDSIVIKKIGRLSGPDSTMLATSLHEWLGF